MEQRTKNRRRNILGNSHGLTLVETLTAMLLISLLSVIILVGTHAAMRVNFQETFLAESQTVADTIEQALSDVLRYAVQVETDPSGAVTAYSNKAYGVYDGVLRVGMAAEDEGLLYLYYAGEGAAENILLLSDLSYSGLKLVPPDYVPGDGSDRSEFDLRYSQGVFIGSYRLYQPRQGLLSEKFEFSFRAVNH